MWRSTFLKGGQPAARLTTKLYYVDEYINANAITTPWLYNFRGNSLYDPDKSGTGHQPLNFDVLSTIYDSYYVTACKIKAKFISESPSFPGYNFAIYASLAEADLGQIYDASGANWYSYKENHLVKARDGREYAAPITASQKSISMYRKTKQFVPFKQLLDDNWTAPTSGNPTNVWYYEILVASKNNVATVDGRLQVYLTYYCTFFNPKVTVQN